MDWLDCLEQLDSDGSPPLDDLAATVAWYTDEEGVPVIPRKVWEELIGVHSQEAIKKALADHIIGNNVPFPYQQITRAEVEHQFRRLRYVHVDDLVHSFDAAYQARFDYPRWTPDHGLGVLTHNNRFNVISNHYQQPNRWACAGYRTPSPRQLWGDRKALETLNWTFWRYTVRGVNRERFRHSFGISHYVASQFKPQVAKVMYQWLGQGTVLDPSCGWGDRLAGFYCTTGAHTYIGTDPNRACWETYQRQCLDYERFLGCPDPEIKRGTVEGFPFFTVRGSKTVTILCSPAEDVPWERLAPDGVDLVFTSPPYFGVEKYAEGTESEASQSWSRYPDFDDWRDGFLLPLVRRLSGLLTPSGHCAINIVDPFWKGNRMVACEPMGDALEAEGLRYSGFIAMDIRKRPTPNPDNEGLEAKYAEPIWVFSRGHDTPPLVEDALTMFIDP